VSEGLLAYELMHALTRPATLLSDERLGDSCAHGLLQASDGVRSGVGQPIGGSGLLLSPVPHGGLGELEGQLLLSRESHPRPPLCQGEYDRPTCPCQVSYDRTYVR